MYESDVGGRRDRGMAYTDGRIEPSVQFFSSGGACLYDVRLPKLYNFVLQHLDSCLCKKIKLVG